MYRLKSKFSKALMLIAFICFSVFCSVGLSTILYSNTFAAVSKPFSSLEANNTKISWQVNNKLHISALYECMLYASLKDGNTGLTENISNAHMISGDWWKNDHSIVKGPYVDGGGAVVSNPCSNASVPNDAINFWNGLGSGGFATPRLILCEYARMINVDDGKACSSTNRKDVKYQTSLGMTGSVTEDPELAAKNLQKNIVASQGKTHTKAADELLFQKAYRYDYYKKMVSEKCITGLSAINWTPGQESETGQNGYNQILFVNTPQDPKDAQKVILQLVGGSAIGSDHDLVIQYLQIGEDGKYGQTESTCKDLKTKMSSYAESALKWMQKQYGYTVKASLIYETADDVDPGADCAIDGVGWIICPVVRFLGKAVDGAYWAVDKFMTTPAINTNTSDANNGLYNAWKVMLSFANIAFIIAFLLIIFAQITSVGISNYGIKKMLPKLIVAAILVNLSYYICAILVDVSNIAGASMKQLFDGIGNGIAIPTNSAVKTGDNMWSNIGSTVIVGGLVGGFTLYAGLSVLLPALVTALFAVITLFLTLTIRQALIILLIVVSPLAFVAYLLPNTEGLFKKWQKLFQTMLLMYPIVTAIFGISALASRIIMSVENANFAVQIMGALITVVPLFLSPIIMKSAGSLLNSMVGAFNNNKLIKGTKDRAQKGAEDYHQSRKDLNTLKRLNYDGPNPWKRARKVGDQRSLRRAAIIENRKKEMGQTTTDYVSDRAKTNEGFRKQLARGGGEGSVERAYAGSISAQGKLWDDNVTAAGSVFGEEAYETSELYTVATTGKLRNGKDASGEQMEAATKSIVESGHIPTINNLINHAANHVPVAGTADYAKNTAYQKSLGAYLTKNNKEKCIGGGTIGELSNGKFGYKATDNPDGSVTYTRADTSVNKLVAETIKKRSVSQEGYAGMSPDEIKAWIASVTSNEGVAALQSDPAAAADAIAVINKTLSNDKLLASMGDTQKELLGELAGRMRLQGQGPLPQRPPAP